MKFIFRCGGQSDLTPEAEEMSNSNIAATTRIIYHRTDLLFFAFSTVLSDIFSHKKKLNLNFDMERFLWDFENGLERA